MVGWFIFQAGAPFQGEYKMTRIRFFVSICLFSLAALAAFTPAPVRAETTGSDCHPRVFLPLVLVGSPEAAANPLPSLDEFVTSLASAGAQGLQGIYVPATFAYHVVPQPDGNYGYVSAAPDTVTQFGLAGDGVVGLLGHVDLAGKRFPDLRPGEEVDLIWADRSVRRFSIASTGRYQAVDPQDPSSDFIDLDTGAQISAADLFAAYYTGGEHVTLQTCIEQNGDPSWGRLFVVAEPMP